MAACPAGKVAGMAAGGPAARRRQPMRRLKEVAGTVTAETRAGEEAVLADTEEAGAGAGENLEVVGQRRPRLSSPGG